MIFSTLFLTAAVAAAEPPAPPSAPPAMDPRQMSGSEIRAHNANLQATDPNYIRCERTAEIGSLIARHRSCRTNAQWAEADEIGNANGREVQEAMRSKSWNTSN